MSRRLNWRWLGRRIRSVRCHHVWDSGVKDQAMSLRNAACQKCGVWRWFPLLPEGVRFHR